MGCMMVVVVIVTENHSVVNLAMGVRIVLQIEALVQDQVEL